jgi:glycosyltransferase 2 family protein
VPNHVEDDLIKKNKAALLIGLATLALIAFVIYRWRTTGFQWSAFAATFTNVNWIWLILCIPVILLTYFGRALRWEVMVRPLREHPSLWNIFTSTAIGFTAIVFFGRAGELVRPYLIANKERVTFSSQMAAWVLERILDLLMVMLIFGIALSRISSSGFKPGPHLKIVLQAGGMIIVVLGGGCLLLLVLFRYFAEPMHRRIVSAVTFLPRSYQGKIDRFLGSFVEGMNSTRSNGFVLQLLGYSVLEWSLITLVFAMLFRSFPQTAWFSLTDVIIFMGFTSFGAAVQIPGVGGGMQVASVIVLTEFFKLPLEVATGLAIVIWIVTFVVVVPFGLALGFREGLNWRKLSQISEDVAA